MEIDYGSNFQWKVKPIVLMSCKVVTYINEQLEVAHREDKKAYRLTAAEDILSTITFNFKTYIFKRLEFLR
jgi:hypothetical protein